MKITMFISLMITSFVISTATYSHENVHETLDEKVEKVEKQSTEQPKKRRRKKVLMCQECGKPETECECEGHGNNEEHEKESEDHKHEGV